MNLCLVPLHMQLSPSLFQEASRRAGALKQPVVSAQVYKKLTEEKGKSFEIVYVPATVPGRTPESEEAFKELMGTMPWLAVPIHRRATHKKLTRRFQVRQIPMLVLLDQEGKTVHRDITPAVTHIVEDTDGETFAEQFPWLEKRHTNIKQMLGDSFLKGDMSEVGINELDGKYIGILFSASWHTQCRRFTQLLEYLYEKLKGEGKQFEIIDMDHSGPDMPWLAMPIKSYEAKQQLGEVREMDS
jgi:thiol-disulfide isomerase/thioredoxin